ncbi:flagellar hook-length control protein FliK [Psychromonas sp. 14N.309.X.WAT.B.A12]|uniref:flagellar hook-length control protein FliK n=1 Tax=Psychromonas sp. 14N.309.X.WAT.B.A12 TaxID=2998322 RepID=UPI0025AF749D|nr:flagellar hook-length control protein FliK [Psychromonas sp. 14N.309.X.WAT.B.A12]MDN2662839.1 flagellar hook-length control protein FliK [Psychromonas sp. 14N.309.X.WAT.B.A12]
MVQPLMFASTTTSDLKAHKENEILGKSILSEERSEPAQKQQGFSQLLNDKIEENKAPTVTAALADAKKMVNATERQTIESQSDESELNVQDTEFLSVSSTQVTGQDNDVAVSTDSPVQTLLSSDVIEQDELADKNTLQSTNKASDEKLPEKSIGGVTAEQTAMKPSTVNSDLLTSSQLNSKDLQKTNDTDESDDKEAALEQGGTFTFDNVVTQQSASQERDSESLDMDKSETFTFDNVVTQQSASQEGDSESLGIDKNETFTFDNVVTQQSILQEGDVESLDIDNKATVRFDNLNGQATIERSSISDDSVEDANTTLVTDNGQATQSQQAQLLSSIRDAQQMNTNVNNSNENSLDSIDQINVLSKKANLQASQHTLLQEQKIGVESDGQEGLSTLNNKILSLAKDEPQIALPELVTEEDGQLDNPASISTTLKVEGQAAAQTMVDVNGAKPIQTSIIQSDKLVSMNQHMQATNNLLQEPLDIQSKQAAHLMGERVMMMLSEGKQEVQIRLDPAELGSMFIKVQVQQDQVQLNIQTQAGLSKDIIEQNMPRLREQLAQQGIQLSDANVEQQSQQQQQSGQHQSMQAMNSRGANDADLVEDNSTAIWMPSKIASNDQGIDYYA